MAVGIPDSARIGLQTRFLVTIDGLDLGGWSKCVGLAVEFTVDNYVPMGHNNFAPVLPNQVKYGKITLSRAVNSVDTPKLMQWLGTRANKGASGTGAIAVLGPDAKPVMAWHLRGVYPTAWKGPQLDASAKAVAIEELELSHEGFLPGM